MPTSRFRQVVTDDALEAFRHLCELVHRPTERRLERCLDFDWTPFPKIHVLVSGETRPTPSLMSVRMRAFLEEACTALASEHPSTDESLSGLDVVRCHLLEGHSWEAITAERMEKGAPVSARTLRTRQREGLRAVLEWAGVRSEALDAGNAASSATRTQSTGRAAHASSLLLGRVIRIGIAGIALMAILWILGGRDEPTVESRQGVDQLSVLHVGHTIPILDGAHTLPEPLPSIALPFLPGHRVHWGTVVPWEGRFALVFSASSTSAEPGFALLWDPVEEREVWRHELSVTPDEILTHDTLELEATRRPFWPGRPLFGRSESNLGDRVAIAYMQDYSPCFVVVVALRDGRELGRYAHPGRLENGNVFDVDGDGVAEIVLAGTDNAVTRPVVVALDADDVRGAASTVRWRETPGIEDARARAILPDVPSFRDATGEVRLVARTSGSDFNSARGTLTVHVEASIGGTAYSAYQLSLGRDLRPVPGASLVFGDAERRTWNQLGRVPPDRSVIVEGVEVHGR